MFRSAPRLAANGSTREEVYPRSHTKAHEDEEGTGRVLFFVCLRMTSWIDLSGGSENQRAAI
jgi:hypothetical protein